MTPRAEKGPQLTPLQQKILPALLLLSLLLYITYLIKIFAPFSACMQLPFMKYDFGYHYANTSIFSNLLSQKLSLLNYNPYLGAGIPDFDSGSFKSAIITNFLLFFLPDPLRYNVGILVILLCLPFLFLSGISLFTRDTNIRKISFIFSILFLTQNKMAHEFISIGHFGFLISIVLSLNAVGFLWNYFTTGQNSFLLLQGIVAGLALWSHPLAPLLLIVPYISIMHFFRANTGKICAVILFGTLFGFIPNLLWITHALDYFLTKYVYGTSATFLQTTLQANTNNLKEPLSIFLFIAALFTLTQLVRKKNLSYFKLAFPTLLLLLIFSSIGTQIGLADLQPTRFNIALLLTAGILLIFYYKKLMIYPLIFFFILSCIKISTYNINVGCGLQDKSADTLLSFIRTNLSKASRIHIQDSIPTLPYFDTRFTGLLPVLTKIPTLANGFTVPIKYTQFIDDNLYNSSLSELSSKKFLNNANMYNTEYYLIFSDGAKEFFRKKTDAQVVYHDKQYMIAKLRNFFPSYCFECQADIDFEYNQIIVTNAKQPRLILKFYYHEKMVVDPPTVIVSPIYLNKDDPKPFISINNGNMRNFTIHVRN